MTKIDDLKRNISLTVLYEQETGNRLKASSGKLTGLCPFHSDSKVGNFFIYEDTDSFNCFACGFGGSNIDFIQRLHKLSFVDAVNYLSGERTKIFDLFKHPVKDPIVKSSILTSKDLEIYKFFFNCLELTEKGKKYLLGRGFCEQTLNKYRISALDRPQTVFKRLQSEFSINDVLSSGLGGKSVKNKPYFTFYLPAIIFTVFEGDQPVYFSSRNLTSEKNKRFFKLHNKPQKYYFGDLTSNEVWIFEGWLDGLSYYELTGLENFIVLSGLSKIK